MLQNTAVIWSPRTQHFNFHFQTPLRMLSLREDTTTQALQSLVFADRKRKWKPTQLPTSQPPRNRSRAPRPRGPGIPDRKKGPKKPTAEPTSMLLSALLYLVPTHLIATCTVHTVVCPTTCRRKLPAAVWQQQRHLQKALPRPWSWRRWRHRHYLSTIAWAPTRSFNPRMYELYSLASRTLAAACYCYP